MAINQYNFNISIKPEIMSYLIDTDTNKTVNLSVAIFLFLDKKVSLARAAELSDLSLGEFVDILIKHNINWSSLTEEDIILDNNTLEYILDEEKHI